MKELVKNSSLKKKGHSPSKLGFYIQVYLPEYICISVYL